MYTRTRKFSNIIQFAIIAGLLLSLGAAPIPSQIVVEPSGPISAALSLSGRGGAGSTIQASCKITSTNAYANLTIKLKGGKGVKAVTTNSWNRPITANGTISVSAAFTLKSTGNRKISCWAYETQKDGQVWADEDTAFIQVTLDGYANGWKTTPRTINAQMQLLEGAQRQTAPADIAAISASDGPAGYREAAAAACAQTLYRGRFLFYDRGTYKPTLTKIDHTTAAARRKFSLKPLSSAWMRLYNAGTNAEIAASITDETGYWEICTASPGTNVYAKVFTQSSWKVVSMDGSGAFSQVYAGTTGSQPGPDLGSWVLPTNAPNLLAFWAFHDLTRATYYFYNPIRAEVNVNASPGTYVVGPFTAVNVRWTPSSTTGTYYDRAVDTIYLEANDPRTPSTTTHEFGHFLMDKLYIDLFWPSGFGGCPLSHSYTQISTRNCAWIEGFASAVSLMVNNNKIYRWPNGSAVNNESRAGFADGDRVEGNVAATFWDWIDARNDGVLPARDYVQYKIDRFLQTINENYDDTFAHYFVSWKSYRDYCTPVLNAMQRNINTARAAYSCPAE